MLSVVVHKRLLALRNLETIIQLRDFQSLFDSASVSDKLKAQIAVDDFDPIRLRNWYKQQRLQNLGILSVRELRQLASQYGIAHYNKLTKPLLLSEIARKQRHDEGRISASDPDVPRGHEGTHAGIGCGPEQVPAGA